MVQQDHLALEENQVLLDQQGLRDQVVLKVQLGQEENQDRQALQAEMELQEPPEELVQLDQEVNLALLVHPEQGVSQAREENLGRMVPKDAQENRVLKDKEENLVHRVHQVHQVRQVLLDQEVSLEQEVKQDQEENLVILDNQASLESVDSLDCLVQVVDLVVLVLQDRGESQV